VVKVPVDNQFKRKLKDALGDADNRGIWK